MTYTANQMQPAIGETIAIRLESLTVNVRVMDAKTAWGNVRLLVRPCMGEGETWIDCSRVVRVIGRAPTQQPSYTQQGRERILAEVR